jgi:hypothetical protein
MFAPVRDLGDGDALESWRWLVGAKAQVRLLTAMGDLFLLKPTGWFQKQKVYLLDTYSGQTRPIESDWASFKKRMAQPDTEVSEWVKYDILCDLHAAALTLSPGECFSPKIPMILGGAFEPDNFSATDWRVHISISGQIHQQVKDLPAGTPISGIHIE